MLKGLEISEVMFSYTENSSSIFRLDSNFYQKEFLLEEKIIHKRESRTLREIGAELRSFGAYSLNSEVAYLESGVPFIRGVNMKRGRVSFSDLIYIDERAHALLWKSEILPEMVLLSMSGTIGEVALASKNWKYPINSNQDIAKIDTKGKISAYVLYVFLLSKFGQNYLKREARGSVQQHVFLSQIEQFDIPNFSAELESAIQRLIEKSDEAFTKADTLYAKAEALLLDTLGLTDFVPSEDCVSVKAMSDTFVKSGRLDAEYYLPKFDQLEAAMAARHTLKPLKTFLTVNQRGTQPEYSDEGLLVVNSKHVREGHVLFSDNRTAAIPEKPSSVLIKNGDVLLNGTGVGTIGRAAPYLLNEPAIPDNHVTVLRSADLNPIFLSLYLNSIAGKFQVEKFFKGSSGQIELYPNDIDCFYVPVVTRPVQDKIAALVEQSATMKDEGARLQEFAKDALELAIEKGDAAAVEYIGGAA